MLALSSYHIRPWDALVFDYTKKGDLPNLQRLFDKGEASPFDRNPFGETLLHVRLSQDATTGLEMANVRRSPLMEFSRRLVAFYLSKVLIVKHKTSTIGMSESGHIQSLG